jgi:hypothetical protein
VVHRCRQLEAAQIKREIWPIGQNEESQEVCAIVPICTIPEQDISPMGEIGTIPESHRRAAEGDPYTRLMGTSDSTSKDTVPSRSWTTSA